MRELFTGPWKVLTGVDKLTNRLLPGEIIKHKNGALILNCPKCNSVQFTRARMSGTDETPTIEEPIQCGGGYCDKCGIWFQVKNGRTLPVEVEQNSDGVEIPKKLRDAGVHPSPKLPPEVS